MQVGAPTPGAMSETAEPPKPLLRGKLHRAAFILYIVLAGYLLYRARPGLPRLSLLVYLTTLLNLYGTSSILHMTDWKRPFLEVRVQKVDHASIFLLIAGTYTPLCLCCLPGEPWTMHMLLGVWTIAIAGVIKCMIWLDAPRAFNVGFYFACGLTIIPFVTKVVQSITIGHMACIAGGGILYLAGGVIYGIQAPDPFPRVYGFHEIFHTLTILANMCFLRPLLACVLQ